MLYFFPFIAEQREVSHELSVAHYKVEKYDSSSKACVYWCICIQTQTYYANKCDF